MDRRFQWQESRASRLEKENAFLRKTNESLEERNKTLQASLELMREAQENINIFFDTIEMVPGMDREKWRKDLLRILQKYHPDKNSNKTYPANEIAADIIPLLKGLREQRV